MAEQRAGTGDARYGARIAAFSEAIARADLGGALIGAGSDLRYLTGYAAMPLERLTVLVIAPGSPPFIVVPRLERAAAEAGLRLPLEIRTWGETEDPYATATDGLAGRLAVSDTMLALHLLRLQASAGAVSGFELATPLLRDLRMVKDADEIEALRQAAAAADRVVRAISSGPLVGRTEANVAAEVRLRLVQEGHDEASFAIVASGPNSASPHHEASDRVIAAGEPIVLDIGGSLHGYASDTTRTLWVTGGDVGAGPDPDFLALFGVLHAAQLAATAAVRPGIACQAVDAAAREPITAAGYGEAFLHRTGHGIGLEVHEEPYIVAGSDIKLRPGMAFSIEPGIYLSGRYGARIEDIVVCGEDGAITLNQTPRDLAVVSG